MNVRVLDLIQVVSVASSHGIHSQEQVFRETLATWPDAILARNSLDSAVFADLLAMVGWLTLIEWLANLTKQTTQAIALNGGE
jgi:hypothetical protein